ncbi:dihydrofolate reductase family protein [Actinomyces polynesiensis]|uniref:dihydrofolate reductase family protein n=1 Tax=Actinomyces polynesiensis TaxID=1325934 RepID=UPI00093F54CE|nr:dihydrofolate reductase family protein [Actinomyces polynesiensis]
MRVVVHEFMTLDGVVQGPGSPDEDPDGGFTQGGWILPFVRHTEWGEVIDRWFERADTVLLGRRTHDIMRPYWSEADAGPNPAASALHEAPKFVISTTASSSTWENTRVIARRPCELVDELRGRPGGELQVHGSWQVVRALQRADLVDEYRMIIFPVVVGSGKRLFPDGCPPISFGDATSEWLGHGITYRRLAVAGRGPLVPRRRNTGGSAFLRVQ